LKINNDFDNDFKKYCDAVKPLIEERLTVKPIFYEPHADSFFELWCLLEPLLVIPLNAFRTTADNNAKHKAKSLAILESSLDTTTAATFMEVENETAISSELIQNLIDKKVAAMTRTLRQQILALKKSKYQLQKTCRGGGHRPKEKRKRSRQSRRKQQRFKRRQSKKTISLSRVQG
jgi:hypothetical protein